MSTNGTLILSFLRDLTDLLLQYVIYMYVFQISD